MAQRVRRALVSTFDKAGVVEFCSALQSMNIEILSSGVTARLLLENDIPVTQVPDYTGFPEMLDGRVKTLHPKIHGGILAVRGNSDHVADLERNNIQPIDLVVVNLYPFQKSVTDGANEAEAIEDSRATIAFYAGVKQYESFFEAHGYLDVVRKLQEGVRRGDYKSVAHLVPDEMVRTFVAVGVTSLFVGLTHESGAATQYGRFAPPPSP